LFFVWSDPQAYPGTTQPPLEFLVPGTPPFVFLRETPGPPFFASGASFDPPFSTPLLPRGDRPQGAGGRCKSGIRSPSAYRFPTLRCLLVPFHRFFFCFFMDGVASWCLPVFPFRVTMRHDLCSSRLCRDRSSLVVGQFLGQPNHFFSCFQGRFFLRSLVWGPFFLITVDRPPSFPHQLFFSGLWKPCEFLFFLPYPTSYGCVQFCTERCGRVNFPFFPFCLPNECFTRMPFPCP